MDDKMPRRKVLVKEEEADGWKSPEDEGELEGNGVDGGGGGNGSEIGGDLAGGWAIGGDLAGDGVKIYPFGEL